MTTYVFELLSSSELEALHFEFLKNLTTMDQDDERRSHSAQYFKWKLLQNQAGSSYVCFAFDVNDGARQPHGCMTFTRKPSATSNKLYELGDAYVAPVARGQKLFRKLLGHALQGYGDGIIYGTPNQAAWPTEKALGFATLPIGLHYRIWSLNIPLAVWQKLCKFSGWPDTQDTPVPQDVFQRCVGTPDDFLEKTQSYLEWRYLQAPDQYQIIDLSSGAGTTLMVVRLFSWKGLRCIMLVDHVGPPLTFGQWLLFWYKMRASGGHFMFSMLSYAAYERLGFAAKFSIKVRDNMFIIYPGDAKEIDFSLFKIGDGDNI